MAYKVEISSGFAEFWRYNIAVTCGMFGADDVQCGFVSAEDKEAVGMTTCLLSGSKLYVVCSKPGVAAVTVTALVGGTSQTGSNAPIATEVTKKFAIVVRDGGTAGNGGWL